jgi:hypothetical protein
MNPLRVITAIVLFVLAVATPGQNLAQTAPAQPATQSATATASDTAAENSETSTAAEVLPATAVETRDQFLALLERHPPQLGKVLKLDPTLFNNPAYLASYPALAAFIAQHPEVAHTPAYYLEGIWVGEARPESPSERVWRDAMEGFSIFLVMGLVASVLIWLVRTLIQYRRWSRVSRVQAEVHNKLMDRFATNEELLTYISTPSGKRFLETAPLTIDTAQPSMGAPGTRILWSTQVGLVVMAAGVGLWVVSGNAQKDVAQPLSALGVLAIAIGIGFILSAVVSFVLSRKLGLWGGNAAAPELGD